MKHLLLFALILLGFTTSLFSQVQTSSAFNKAYKQALGNNNYIEGIIYMSLQSDLKTLDNEIIRLGLPNSERGKIVVKDLLASAEKGQADLINFIKKSENKFPELIFEYKSLWVRSAIYVKARPAFFAEIFNRDDIELIDLNYGKFRMTTPVTAETSGSRIENGVEPGIIAINTRPLWDMGYTGRNTILLSMDTGVWVDHPALSDMYLGNHVPTSQAWYGMRSNTPADNASSSHGTHTTGTVLGLHKENNDTIGVAYNAYFMATDPVASNVSELLDPLEFMVIYQWVLNPDGDPETSSDMPDVINNSWGFDYDLAIQFNACEMQETQVYEAIEIAGICSPFSAGNEGPGISTTGFPAMLVFNDVNIMSVGAVNGNNPNYPIADFSSRGPTPCFDGEGSLKIKPEVSAPGMAVRSAAKHSDYSYLSGTSMACPHVSGALLLLREAFPEASAYELKKSLYETAIDLGEEGEDNVYGKGIIDVLAAFNYLSESYTPTPPLNKDYDLTCEIIIEENQDYCWEGKELNPKVLITNKGNKAIENISIKAEYNGVEFYSGIHESAIQAGESINIDLPQIFGNNGFSEIHASVLYEDAEIKDFNLYDNYAIKRIKSLKEVQAPYFQNFDTIKNDFSNIDWIIINDDNERTWALKKWGDNDNKVLFMNFSAYLPRIGQYDDIMSSKISLPTEGNISLDFKYAYKARAGNRFNDSLVVLVSTDCGLSFPYEISEMHGENMATIGGNSGGNIYTP
ncbi:MAG: S8 family serine peptidase, partial [Bacteroidales bacterium]|nr:S8 family serine peptidase [Bacteroidales bacterium]